MEIVTIGNLTIRLNRETGEVEIDTNGAPWTGKIEELGIEVAALLEATEDAEAA